MYNRAEAAIDLKKYDLAISLMQDVISTYPEYSYAYYVTAKAYFWAHNYEKSEEYIKVALSFQANNVDYLTQYSASLIFAEKYDEGLETVEKALEQDPVDSLAIYYKAYCLYKMGEFNRAKIILYWYLEQYPNDAVAHCILGEIYNELGDLNVAEKEFLESLRLNPNSSTTFNNFGVMFMGNNNAKALELLQEAIRLNPANKICEQNLQSTIEEMNTERKNNDTLYCTCLGLRDIISNNISFIVVFYFFTKILCEIFNNKYCYVIFTTCIIGLLAIYIVYIISKIYVNKFEQNLNSQSEKFFQID